MPTDLFRAAQFQLPDAIPTLWAAVGGCLLLLLFLAVLLLFYLAQRRWRIAERLGNAALFNSREPVHPYWVVVLAGLLFLFLGSIMVTLAGSYLIIRNQSENMVATVEAIVPATQTAASLLEQITPTPERPTPTATAVPLPSSCAMIRAQQPGAADGEYTLYLDGRLEAPFTVYCHQMQAIPAEYLTVPRTGGNFNYSMISYPEGALITHYQRVRLNPHTLIVDTTDRTFATNFGPVPGYTSIAEGQAASYPVAQVDYGLAQGCNRNQAGAPPGQANIDLSDTPFVLAAEVEFVAQGGHIQSPLIEINENRQIVSLSVNGRCALIKPAPQLRLVYVN